MSWRIKEKDPKANIVVAPSDHLITDVVEFQRVIKECLKFTSETDAIVTLGMKPNEPHTGYGYIEADLSSNSARNKELYRVDSFHEKPKLELAKQYVAQNNYFWNAGIFIWSVETIVNAFRVYAPAMNKIFESMLPIYGTEKSKKRLTDVILNVRRFLSTMPFSRKRRRYLYAPQTLVGPTWAVGIHFMTIRSTICIRILASGLTSRCLTHAIASCILLRRSKLLCRDLTAILWPRVIIPFWFARFQKVRISRNI